MQKVSQHRKPNQQRHITNDKIEAAKEREMKTVKGIFRNYETPGGKLEFSERAWPNEPKKKWSFIDGEEYEIPLYIARWISKNTAYPVHSYLLDDRGRPIIDVGKMVYRFGFQSTEFMGDPVVTNAVPKTAIKP
jgi:hypothetical protein